MPVHSIIIHVDMVFCGKGMGRDSKGWLTIEFAMIGTAANKVSVLKLHVASNFNYITRGEDQTPGRHVNTPNTQSRTSGKLIWTICTHTVYCTFDYPITQSCLHTEMLNLQCMCQYYSRKYVTV